jgi:hypothetical protein
MELEALVRLGSEGGSTRQNNRNGPNVTSA